MDFSNTLVKLYVSETFIQTALGAIFFAALAGHMIHRFLGKASFGSVANAAIILAAISCASWFDDQRLAMLLPENNLRISLISTGIAAGMLMMVAGFKSWLRDHI